MPPAAPASRYKFSHWRKALILRTKKPFFAGPAVTRDLSAQPAVLIGLIAHVVGTCHDQAWQRARSRRTRFTCDAASRAPASLIRARGSGGSAKRSSTSSMRASTCGRHHMSLHEGLSWISAKRRRMFRAACWHAGYGRPPKAPVFNARRPAGGLEQALSKLNVDV